MEKYLKRLCKAILEDRFNDKNYRSSNYWYGHKIQTQTLFCSYGAIGFTVSVYDLNGSHFCDVDWDVDLGELTIDDEPWRDYINTLYLEDHDITSNGDGELELYTDAGEDMIITLDRLRKRICKSTLTTSTSTSKFFCGGQMEYQAKVFHSTT